MSERQDTLQIRPASAADYEELRNLFFHLIPDDLPLDDQIGREKLKAMLAHPGLTTLIGSLGNDAVSTCTLVVMPNFTRAGAPYALIENVVTHGDHRGKGFGQTLLQAAFELAWKQDCYKIMLMTGAANTGAQKFYRKVGFKSTKTGFELRAPGYPSRKIT
ncbi:GNAT family N-acetyltransferase [Roseibium algae]|uniref:GNAT family N-acetyltransferase n=1 Tax=Roseibium algae TaxID=3123038 RepID=A0ABU8TQL7_9HYPH